MGSVGRDPPRGPQEPGTADLSAGDGSPPGSPPPPPPSRAAIVARAASFNAPTAQSASFSPVIAAATRQPSTSRSVAVTVSDSRGPTLVRGGRSMLTTPPGP